MHIRRPIRKPIVLRNVAGFCQGQVRSGRGGTYLIVTAAYDGAYTRRGDPDPILNGANANASRVASLIEAAATLSKQKPRHSILFVTLFGAELGGLGAAYLSQHPLVPIEKSVGCINLSHLGRTDAAGRNENRRAHHHQLSGVEGSRHLRIGGKQSGIGCRARHERQERWCDGRGFKPFLYDRNVPSHTVYVALAFRVFTPLPISDKIDYKNMAAGDA